MSNHHGERFGYIEKITAYNVKVDYHGNYGFGFYCMFMFADLDNEKSDSESVITCGR
ncbi:hypothetical protein KEH51_07725 [[Brevibacterium] frigoritolerans]|uniref:Uncharacterized protein n=1 Tax=Peribacillus frigoritolerans TaxID=450367 RepID=A0A941FGR1_9BACI|nr:hypothetical protein [Peribacillus frigoritolerans]